LLPTAFVTGTVNADQKETKRVKPTDMKEGKQLFRMGNAKFRMYFAIYYPNS
jgi:hypothetical protein